MCLHPHRMWQHPHATPSRDTLPHPSLPLLRSPPREGESLPRPASALKRLPRPEPGAGQPAFLPPSLPAQRWEVASPRAAEGMRSCREEMHYSGQRQTARASREHGAPRGDSPQQPALVLLLSGTWKQEVVRYRAFR